MGIQIRKALPKDKADILRISAQVWEGTDYVPRVLDRWLSHTGGVLWVADWDGVVAGFSRMTFLNGEKCWMEGIRVDTALRGKGIGKALTDFQIEEGFRMGFVSCGLSSYLENYESLQIVRTKGFVETARFKVFDLQGEVLTEVMKETRSNLLAACSVERLDPSQGQAAAKRLLDSDMLSRRGGYLSYDWTFDSATAEWIQSRVESGEFYLLRKGGQETLFSLSDKHAKGSYHTVNFIEDESLAPEVLAFALMRMEDWGENTLGYMATDHRLAGALEGLGLSMYNPESQDVYVFEKKGRAD